MFATLSPEAIGILGATLAEAIDLAHGAGFAGLAFDAAAAAAATERDGIAAVRDRFAQAGMRPASWSLPGTWLDDECWPADAQRLPRLAEVARQLGGDRVTTWLPSGTDDRPYDENWEWQIARLRPIAETLRGAGCRLGLEFIGPKTFRDRFRYPFVHTLSGVLDLAAAIGTGNVGVLLDSWHLYTSGGTLADLDRLAASDVVVVHVNDAPAGVPRDEQIDTVRELPLASGVIDLVGFMSQLRRLGYDGPVTPEPFSAPLNELAGQDPAAAAAQAAASMTALWRAAGLA